MRAFLNGQLDLAQAEAVADLIASENEAAHRAAIQQMRGGFSEEIKHLREELVHFASLIELELDFGEEDVEFADRTQLRDLISKILSELDRLKTSFKLGNVIKNGIPVAIVGKPNAGKSTLLNALLNEERAIVSPIAGTTRDVIEDSLIVEGIKFRLMDTAGLRQTTDTIEAIGVDRAIEKLKEAKLVLYLFDAVQEPYQEALASFQTYLSAHLDATFILVANKIDEIAQFNLFPSSDFKSIAISAKEKNGLDNLKKLMLDCILGGINPAQFQDTTLVTNARHASALESAHHSLSRALSGIETGITGDLIAMDIRSSLRDLGEIIGDTDVEDLLDNIFSKFCIGK
jgi:tRNA modification GTPase